jgi:hypothetical protein
VLVKGGPVVVIGASCVHGGGIVDGQSLYVEVRGGSNFVQGALSVDQGAFVLLRGGSLEG